MRPTMIQTLLVFLLGVSAVARSTPAEGALLRAGEDAEPRPERRIRILVGVTDWHWEEGMDSRSLLSEDGMVPGIRLEYARRMSSFELGGGLDFSYGAIEYDGALQDVYGNLEDYRSNSHYSIVGVEGFVFATRFLELLDVHTKGFAIEPGLRCGFQSWVRTIDSKKYGKPGDYGYIENWDMGILQPVIALRVPFGKGRSYARLEAGARMSIGDADNEISRYPIVKGDIMLHPKPKTGCRVQGMVALGRVLLELEYIAQDFDASDTKTVGGILVVGQPDSYLDRLDARIGLEF